MSGGQGRTGAGTGRPQEAPPSGRVEAVVHRGIRWQRAPSGRVRWWNEELERWVHYHRGDDAPPRPPGWEPPPPPRPVRAGWRSPWRLVPLLVAVAVLVGGLVQALRSNKPATTEISRDRALVGKCLRQDGTVHGRPAYASTPVPCTSPHAAVRVVSVIVTSPSGTVRSCPAGTTLAEILCVKPLSR